MTSNQIAYWKLKEQERTDRANEEISSRQAGAAEKNALTNQMLAQFKTGPEFKDSQKRFVGDFLLKWGANLANASKALLS